MAHKPVFTLLFAAAIATLTACQKETTVTPAPVPATLTARAGADLDVLPDQPATLDGSASTGTGSLTYQWAIVRKPQNSTLVLTGASTAKPTLTPDIVGIYEVELTVTAGADKSQDRVQLKAEQTGPITISSDVKTNTRWKDRLIDPAKPDYIITRDLALTAELTVDPGVTAAFERNVMLNLQNGGTLLAKGFPDNRIQFTGVKAERGYWAGIANYSPSTANALAFVDLAFAGSRGAFNNTKAGLSMFGHNKAQMTLSDCRFSQTEGYGMYVQEGAELRQFARNRFSQHTEAALLMDAYNATRLDDASVFSDNNTRNVVEIFSSAIRGVTDVAWPSFADKTPYRLLGDLAVEAGWTLKPGVTVEVSHDATIRVNRDGYLSAKGTSAQPVTITGSTRTAAHWKGIIVYSISNLNVMEQTDLSGGGSAVMVSGKRAALTVYGRGAKLTIKNSRITGSGGHGIMHTSDAELNTDAGSTNTFSGNTQANTYKL